MNQPERTDDDPLLRVLANHLQRQEATVDVGPLAERILSARPSEASSPRPVQAPTRLRRTWPAWTLGLGSLATAAAIVLMVLSVPSPELRAEQAVQAAQESLLLPVERCYLVEVRPDEDNPVEPALPTRTMRLWATGERFRVEMARANFRWSWGRDADGTVWLTANPQRGLRIAPNEQGPGLLWMAELYALRPETLLSQILAHCRLREDPRPASNFPRVIHAEPRTGARQAWLRSAILELDAETKAIRKLTLKRANKADGGTTTVTFTLIDTRPVDNARYQLEGNLVEPFQIYDRDFEPARRREILSRWVGPFVDSWLRPVAKK